LGLKSEVILVYGTLTCCSFKNKGYGQYALSKFAFCSTKLSYSRLLWKPGSNRRPEVAHIYGTLFVFNVFKRKGYKQQVHIIRLLRFNYLNYPKGAGC
jgi:hypothetical protein